MAKTGTSHLRKRLEVHQVTTAPQSKGNLHRFLPLSEQQWADERTAVKYKRTLLFLAVNELIISTRGEKLCLI